MPRRLASRASAVKCQVGEIRLNNPPEKPVFLAALDPENLLKMGSPELSVH
jgi:hypothetical protein